LIALALTLIEQHLLPERPAFFVTAGQSGSGKTTALNMISMAVFGRQAAAASWSFNDEERRKALFAYLLEGASMVVYDNILRGSGITCQTIERALTSSYMSDRVLGVSETQTVPTSAVVAFTGNNIRPVGDMASRSLVANISADRTDPENREFKHGGPLGWTAGHRHEILRHLFTLLMCPRDLNTEPRTRFKQWWHLVGHPIEIASGVNFNALFRSNDALDEEAAGAAVFVAEIYKYIGNSGSNTPEFTAADIMKLIQWYGPAYMSQEMESAANRVAPDRETLKSALEDASGRPFFNDQVNAHRVGMKLKSIAGRPVEHNGQILRLVVIRDHEGNRYKIEVLGDSN
ncbi:hypothetical protein HGD85_03535, partial [Rhodobacteraceae bacterium R_SAG10]|nr:hypothetical protein [Rhodobacteraceae bacterium R_SAG10]